MFCVLDVAVGSGRGKLLRRAILKWMGLPRVTAMELRVGATCVDR